MAYSLSSSARTNLEFWNDPTGWPNAWRVFTYSMVISSIARVAAVADVEPAVGVATYFSAMMAFKAGVASFTLSSRLRRFQRFLIVGTEGSLDIRVPVMPHPTRPTQVVADYRDTPLTADPEVLEFGPIPSFRAQIENFVDTIRNGTPAPFDGRSSIANALSLEALDRSAKQDGAWVDVELALDAPAAA